MQFFFLSSQTRKPVPGKMVSVTIKILSMGKG